MKKTFAQKHPDKAEAIIRASMKDLTVREISAKTQVSKSTVSRFNNDKKSLSEFLPPDPDIRAAEMLGVEYRIKIPPSYLSYLEYEAIMRGLTPRFLVEKLACIVCGDRMIKAIIDD